MDNGSTVIIIIVIGLLAYNSYLWAKHARFLVKVINGEKIGHTNLEYYDEHDAGDGTIQQ